MRAAYYDILAIDDDMETIEGLLSELALLDYSILQAHEIGVAIEYLKKFQFGVLLVDLRMAMPGSNDLTDNAGVLLLNDLRRGKIGKINKETPYVIVSAQEFWINRLEQNETKQTVAAIMRGRLETFSKGDDIRPITRLISRHLSDPKEEKR
jgi:CheY-like chemotaxis protein